MKLRNYHLEFEDLIARDTTDLIVIHHTGIKGDWAADTIHDWHIGNDFVGIGYHWVIRKDGTLEFGRPEWAIGAHAAGFNWRAIGVQLSGDFELEKPTPAQIYTCAELIRDISDDYGLPLHRGNVKAHCELNETYCPGKNLYKRLDEIISRAK